MGMHEWMKKCLEKEFDARREEGDENQITV
jgi:hypothetical protein